MNASIVADEIKRDIAMYNNFINESFDSLSKLSKEDRVELEAETDFTADITADEAVFFWKNKNIKKYENIRKAKQQSIRDLPDMIVSNKSRRKLLDWLSKYYDCFQSLDVKDVRILQIMAYRAVCFCKCDYWHVLTAIRTIAPSFVFDEGISEEELDKE